MEISEGLVLLVFPLWKNEEAVMVRKYYLGLQQELLRTAQTHLTGAG